MSYYQDGSLIDKSSFENIDDSTILYLVINDEIITNPSYALGLNFEIGDRPDWEFDDGWEEGDEHFCIINYFDEEEGFFQLLLPLSYETATVEIYFEKTIYTTIDREYLPPALEDSRVILDISDLSKYELAYENSYYAYYYYISDVLSVPKDFVAYGRYGDELTVESAWSDYNSTVKYNYIRQRDDKAIGCIYYFSEDSTCDDIDDSTIVFKKGIYYKDYYNKDDFNDTVSRVVFGSIDKINSDHLDITWDDIQEKPFQETITLDPIVLTNDNPNNITLSNGALYRYCSIPRDIRYGDYEWVLTVGEGLGGGDVTYYKSVDSTNTFEATSNHDSTGYIIKYVVNAYQEACPYGSDKWTIYYNRYSDSEYNDYTWTFTDTDIEEEITISKAGLYVNRSGDSISSLDGVCEKSIKKLDIKFLPSHTHTYDEINNIPSHLSATASSHYDTSISSAYFPLATYINSNGFEDCTNLTEVEFPNVTEIGSYAFDGCTSLKKVDFIKIAKIGYRAFCNCTALEALIMRSGKIVDLNTYVFEGASFANGTGYIYVPKALIDSYKAATRWSTYAERFRALEDYTLDGTVLAPLDESKINA